MLAEIAAWRTPEVLWILGRDDGECNRGPIPVHGAASFVPKGFRDAKIVPQPIYSIDDVGPGRPRAAQIGPQLRCELHQLVWGDPIFPAPFRLFPRPRLWR